VAPADDEIAHRKPNRPEIAVSHTTDMSDVPKTFFITGASSGFGRAFAAAALHKGHRVVGTVRNQADADRLRALFPYGRAHAELLDVTDDGAVSSAVERTEQMLGPIDVVIANAGYGHEGTIE
jgi:NAD(P)-dependent dehydrogenase (short-subunit alcohol dehydrogenase family)